MNLEWREHHPEKPKTGEALKQSVENTLRYKAEKMMPTFELEKVLSADSVQHFIVRHSGEKLKGYREWNRAFCKDVLGLNEARPADQMMRLMALQLFLNKKVGGFNVNGDGFDSVDGKLGPFTLDKLKQYLELLIKPNPVQQKSSPEAEKGRPELSERVDASKTYCIGDSYMVGLLAGRKTELNRQAVSSSHFSKTAAFDNATYRKKHIFIEEEALKFLENPNCKMLVLCGGINDLYARGGSERVMREIITSYSRVIRKAHEKGVRVTVYSLNGNVEPRGNKPLKILQIRNVCNRINEWLKTRSGADTIIDTETLVGNDLRRDRLHPNSQANKRLFMALNRLLSQH